MCWYKTCRTDGFVLILTDKSTRTVAQASSVKLEMKPQRAMFLGRDHSLVLLGANKMRSPQIAIYDRYLMNRAFS